MDFDERSYDITVSRGAIKHASELFALDRRVLVVTDDGVFQLSIQKQLQTPPESRIY